MYIERYVLIIFCNIIMIEYKIMKVGENYGY